MATTRSTYPNASYGYWRGADQLAGGSGSGMGQPNQGAGMLSQGLGSVGQMGGAWEPSILYLFGFIIVEMVAFHILGRVLK